MFITFEGPDGSGKTTQINKLVEFLEESNIPFVFTREPGTQHSKASEKIREILIDKENEIPPLTEAMLFAADRKMHLEQVILPALKENKLVICDRYVDSSLAYQGAGRQLGIEKIRLLNEIAIENKYPDYTFFFDLKPVDSKLRINNRAESRDRFELSGESFNERVYQGYLDVIKLFPERFVVIDASKPIDEVFEQLKKEFSEKVISKMQ